MHSSDWFKHWFSSPYYDMLYRNRNDEEAKKFMEKLLAYLQPKPNAKMLDAACGKGRHAKCLADMGFDVIAYDLSDEAIDYAKRFENDNLEFYVHDIRNPFWINYFDFAFNFFTSFGYFKTKREDDDAMRSLAQSINDNGILVIDYLNVFYVEENFVSSEIKTIDNEKFYITRWQDEKYFYKQIQIEEENYSLKDIVTEKVSKFTLNDFSEMLARQNMQLKDVFGSYSLEKYNDQNSQRMIIIAKKNKQ